ncbi:MAG: peptidylprolyl isomerase [Pseudomonadota bacterium]
MKRLTSLVFFAGLAGLATIASVSAQPVPLERIVAVVEDEVILRSELERSVANVVKQFNAQGQPLPPRSTLERQILSQLALIRLKLQNARQTGIRVSDAEVDGAISRVAQQSGITEEQMRRTILSDGLSWQRFRDDMRDELVTQQLERRVSNSRVNISESEVDLFLENQDGPEGEFRLSHILIGLPEGATPTQVQGAREEAEKLHQDLIGGTDFSTLAITHSDGPQALQGGDLGWRPANQVPTMLAQEMGEMNRGDFTRPIRDASGFHLFMVSDYRAESINMVRELKASHIMIETSELVTQEEALDTITDIHERVTGGADFGELARQYSDDTTSANLGGDMGWFTPGTFGDRVQQVLDSMESGEISQPFQSVAGWHILQKLDEREQDRSEEIRRAQAREAIRRLRAEEEFRLWERELRDEAYIEYRI